MKSTQHSSSTLLILLCKKRSHTLEAVSKRSSDPSHLPYHYPGLHQTSLETLFGLGAFTLLWYIAFLDTQKMLKPPSRPGQPVGPFQPLIARALGQQQETATSGGSTTDSSVQYWKCVVWWPHCQTAPAPCGSYGISPLWWLCHNTALQLARDASVPLQIYTVSCHQVMYQVQWADGSD